MNVCGELVPAATYAPSISIASVDNVVPLAAVPVALMMTVVATVALFAGELMLAAGLFLTVTVTVDDVVEPPSASVATAVRV